MLTGWTGASVFALPEPESLSMPEAKIELFADQSLACGEGPVWDGENACLYWTDSGGEAIFRSVDEKGGFQAYHRGFHAASLTLHASGGLIICGMHGFHHLTADGELKLVSDRCGELPVTRINDCIADPAGRIFGGQDAFREFEAYEPGYLFRVDADGKTTVADEGLHLGNGMGFSPELDHFYLVDSIPGIIYVYDYEEKTGDLSDRRILIHLDRNEGLPDGITVDAEGFIWVARWFGGGLSRFDPDGRLERTLDVPAAQTSSLCFGGRERNELFITSAAAPWQTALAPDNHQYSTHRGGGLYRIVQDIIGKPEFKATICVPE
jgi:sugar lactone lactonase YvrE